MSSTVPNLHIPRQASVEFGILLSHIIKELTKNEAENLEVIKQICSCLTAVDEDPSTLFFSEEEQQEIDTCGSIRKLFTKHLRHCWRWDDFSFLKNIVQSLDSPNCEQLLNQYEKKIFIAMKLQDIYEYCLQEKQNLPEGYHKVVAIIQEKKFSQITLEEYNKFKKFISEHCKVEPYIISPFIKMEGSSMPSSLQVLHDVICCKYECRCVEI